MVKIIVPFGILLSAGLPLARRSPTATRRTPPGATDVHDAAPSPMEGPFSSMFTFKEDIKRRVYLYVTYVSLQYRYQKKMVLWDSDP